MTQRPIPEVDGELLQVHSESDAEAIRDVVVKRGRGRPRKEAPKRTNKRGRPRKEEPPKEKKPIGRPRKIKEPKEKRPPRRPKKWTEENMADRPKYKPKETEHFKTPSVNVITAKLEARQAEELNDHMSLPMLTTLWWTTLASSIAMMSLNWPINIYLCKNDNLP